MSEAEELERLRQKNALLKAQIAAERKRADRLLIGVGNKLGVWVRWRQRQYPVTLYANEWAILFNHMDEI
jgi:hypothetical protein